MVPKKEHNDLTPEKRIQNSFNAIQDGVSINNRDWYRTLAEDVPVLITRISPEGKVTHANDASCQVIGKPLEEIVGQDFFALVPSEYRELLREDLYSLTPDRPHVTYEHLNHSRLLRWKNRAIFDDKGCLKEFFTIGEDITEQREAEEALLHQFKFEKVVVDISSAFVNMPTEKIDDAINDALKLSGELFNADRSYIFRFSDDGLFINNTHEWCAEGITSQMARNQNYPIADTPWWTEQMMRCEHVYVPDVELLPPEAETDKKDFMIEEIKSLLTIPMLKDGKLFGFFGFDAVKEKKTWTDQQIVLLKVVAEIIAGAIVKQEAEEALKDSEKRYREILATIEEAYYETDLAGNITFYNEAGL